MFNRKKREDVLGVGSVRAPISNEIEAAPIDQETEDAQINQETEDTPVEQETLENLSWEPSIPMETESQQRLLDQLERQILSLEKQLEAKDQQLASKDDIIKNFQVLLKVEQDTVLRLAMSPTKPKFKFSWWKNEPAE